MHRIPSRSEQSRSPSTERGQGSIADHQTPVRHFLCRTGTIRLALSLVAANRRIREVLKVPTFHGRFRRRTESRLDPIQHDAFPLPASMHTGQDVLLLDGEPDMVQSLDSSRFGSRIPGEINESAHGHSDEVMGPRVRRIVGLQEQLGQALCYSQDVGLLGT